MVEFRNWLGGIRNLDLRGRGISEAAAKSERVLRWWLPHEARGEIAARETFAAEWKRRCGSSATLRALLADDALELEAIANILSTLIVFWKELAPVDLPPVVYPEPLAPPEEIRAQIRSLRECIQRFQRWGPRLNDDVHALQKVSGLLACRLPEAWPPEEREHNRPKGMHSRAMECLDVGLEALPEATRWQMISGLMADFFAYKCEPKLIRSKMYEARKRGTHAADRNAAALARFLENPEPPKPRPIWDGRPSWYTNLEQRKRIETILRLQLPEDLFPEDPEDLDE